MTPTTALHQVEQLARRYRNCGVNVGAHQLASDILAIVDRVSVDASEPERLPVSVTRTVLHGRHDSTNPEPDYLPADGPDLLAGD